MIHLENITSENWRKVNNLKVKEDQMQYVATSVLILAKAYAYRLERSVVKVIMENENYVGLLLYRDYPETHCFVFDQLFIDENHQGHNYGIEAVKQVIKLMKEDGKYKRIDLCYCEGNTAAKNLYEKIGFTHTGVVDEDEIVMTLEI
jgi:diamine N-acetyltransferase